jgi:murein DD-endopeptidase MepM/ murein hydrolase activator NlpD
MHTTTKILHLIFLIFFISCSQSKAPIVNRGKTSYGHNSSKNKHLNNKSEANADSVYVASSDTIYSIAKKYNVPINDLISDNNLSPPYILKAGEKIKIPQGQYYQVASGDTLYSISRKYGMNVNSLITNNKLKEPYSVKVGQKLKVNRQATTNQAPSVKIAEATKNPVTQTNAQPAIKENKTQPTVEPKIADKNNHFSWPIKGEVISKFGPKSGGLFNDGINIQAKSGDNVKASEDGVVAYVGNELKGYGNLLIIKHSGGWISAYAHLDKSKVKRGAKVKKGQNIATVGSTGNVKSPQLYFGLRKGREAVNPQTYLKT